MGQNVLRHSGHSLEQRTRIEVEESARTLLLRLDKEELAIYLRGAGFEVEELAAYLKLNEAQEKREKKPLRKKRPRAKH